MQLKKNDEIQLNITALTSEGSALGRKDGVPVFLRGGVPGDVVTAHIIKAKKNYAVARLQQVLEPSPHRVESDCPVSAQCGGCAFRTVDYAEELRFKQQRIDDAFQRIGHLDLQVEGVLAAPDTVRYRNKAQYPVQLQDGRPVAGFYAYKSHRVVLPEIACSSARIFPPVWRLACNGRKNIKFPYIMRRPAPACCATCISARARLPARCWLVL